MKSTRFFQILSISVLSFATALLATPASAQVQAGDWEVGFGLGGTKLDSDLSDDSGFRGEIRGGTPPSPISWSSKLRSNARTPTSIRRSIRRCSTRSSISNTAGRAVPYVLIGAGAAKLDDFDWDFLENTDADGGEGLAYQAALGTRLFFRENGTVAARFEVSSFWEDVLDETHPHTEPPPPL